MNKKSKLSMIMSVALLFCLPFFAACGEDENMDQQTTSNINQQTTSSIN